MCSNDPVAIRSVHVFFYFFFLKEDILSFVGWMGLPQDSCHIQLIVILYLLSRGLTVPNAKCVSRSQQARRVRGSSFEVPHRGLAFAHQVMWAWVPFWYSRVTKVWNNIVLNLWWYELIEVAFSAMVLSDYANCGLPRGNFIICFQQPCLSE